MIRAWSGMAAVALFIAGSIAVGRGQTTEVQTRGQDRGSATAERPEPVGGKPAGRAADLVPVVELRINIAGLGARGCDVEIKPGNTSCKFKIAHEKGSSPTLHVSSDGRVKVALMDVELQGADRVCTVALIVHEAGQPAKTVYRGFRIAAHNQTAKTKGAAAVPAFDCYLSSPSKLAKSAESKARR